MALVAVASVYLLMHKISHSKTEPKMPDFTGGVCLVFIGLEIARVVRPMMDE